MNKKSIIGLTVAALALTSAGAAYAAVNDGTTTRAEAQTRASAMFARMDTNKDGKLDTADRAAHEAERFARLDTDKNGSISPAEMAARHARRPEGAGGSDGGKRGHRMGGRHGGGESMGGHGRGMMMMHRADTDNDQVVSQAEFTATALQHFDSADSNKDGTLTRAERQAVHQAMRAQMRSSRGAMGHGDMPPPAPTN